MSVYRPRAPVGALREFERSGLELGRRLHRQTLHPDLGHDPTLALFDRKENFHCVLVVGRSHLRRSDDRERKSLAVVMVLDRLAVGLQGPAADALLESSADASLFDLNNFRELLVRNIVGAGELHRRDLELATGGDLEAQRLLIAVRMELGADLRQQVPGLLQALFDQLGEGIGLGRVQLLLGRIGECIFGDLQVFWRCFQVEAILHSRLDLHVKRDIGSLGATVHPENLRFPITHPSQVLLGMVPQPVFEPGGEPRPNLDLGLCCQGGFLVGQSVEHHRAHHLGRPRGNHKFNGDRVGLAVEIQVGFNHRISVTPIVEPAFHPSPARIDPGHGDRVTGFELQPPVNLDPQHRALGVNLDLRHPRSVADVDDDIRSLGRLGCLDPQPLHVSTCVECHDDLAQPFLVEMTADLELEDFDDAFVVHRTNGFDPDARHDLTFGRRSGDRNQEEADREEQGNAAVQDHGDLISRDAAS